MTRGRQYATDHTLGFLLRGMDLAPCKRLLEIGCGNGDVAAGLVGAGFEVVALDNSADCIEIARSRGLDARLAEWPDFDDGLFDAVVFTRSLHHIHDLSRGIQRASSILRPRGLVLVEDFAYSQAAASHLDWCFNLATMLTGIGNRTLPGGVCEQIVEARGDVECWHRLHDHDMHTAETMVNALREHFTELELTHAPYLYRYFLDDLHEPAAQIVNAIFRLETQMGQLDSDWLVGRRFIGQRL